MVVVMYDIVRRTFASLQMIPRMRWKYSTFKNVERSWYECTCNTCKCKQHGITEPCNKLFNPVAIFNNRFLKIKSGILYQIAWTFNTAQTYVFLVKRDASSVRDLVIIKTCKKVWKSQTGNPSSWSSETFLLAALRKKIHLEIIKSFLSLIF